MQPSLYFSISSISLWVSLTLIFKSSSRRRICPSVTKCTANSVQRRLLAKRKLTLEPVIVRGKTLKGAEVETKLSKTKIRKAKNCNPNVKHALESDYNKNRFLQESLFDSFTSDRWIPNAAATRTPSEIFIDK